MRKEILGVLFVTLLFLSASGGAYLVKPIFGQYDLAYETLTSTNGSGLSASTVNRAAVPPSGVKTAPKTGADSSLDQYGNFTLFEGNTTRLVVGMAEGKSSGTARLENIASNHHARIVNTVKMKGTLKAVVVELPLRSATSFIEDLRASDIASYVEPNMKVQVQAVPNDPYWNLQWGPQKIGADFAWNTTVGDPSVLVAVIDTGVDYLHPDLAANYVALGRDWVNNDDDPIDDFGHGTHCAGIIAAVMNNNEGIAGLAQVRIMVEKAFDAGGYGYDDSIANAIIHATDSGAKIISMSFGGYTDSQLEHDAVKYAHDAGVLLVASAGNDYSNSRSYPAAYDEVIAVTATDQSDNKAGFSNWGDWVELAAPGVDIYSTMPTYSVTMNSWGWSMNYDYMSGTSMACPHVAGVAALAWSKNSNKTRDWVRMWLSYTADDLGESGFDVNFGYGRVNAQNAVSILPPVHELIAYSWTTPPYFKIGTAKTVNCTVLNFGEDETDVTVQLLANDTIVDSSQITFLPAGAIKSVILAWNPAVEGLYNLTFFVLPQTGETSVENNALMKPVYVGLPVIAAVLHSAGNVYPEAIANWQALSTDWPLLGDKMVYVDYESLNKMAITYEDISATEADVLIISDAYDYYNGWEFTDSEINAITRYVHEGHGLIATYGTLSSSVPNNNKLAPLFGLRDDIYWYSTSTDLMHLLNATHPVFANVPNPIVFPYVGTALPSDGAWSANELHGGTYLAMGHYNEAAIAVRRDLIYISPFLEVIPPYYRYHLQLLYNAIRWSRYEKPAHELAVSIQAPKSVRVGDSTLLNATVLNNGLRNETNVELQLMVNGTQLSSALIPELPVGESQTISYLFDSAVAGMKYNVTAYAPPLQGESDTDDNIATQLVTVSIYASEYFSPRWVGGGTPMGWHADFGTWEYILPFSFPFYGTLYDRIYVSTKGRIAFDWSDYSYDNGIPQLAGRLAIAPAWDDWVSYDPYDTSYDIYVWQNSTHVGIEWYVRHYGSDVVADFEVILRVDGVIQFDYGYNNGPISATIGISDGNSDIIAEDVTDLNYIHTIIFTPPLREHDLAVWLQTPSRIHLGESSLFNATVINLGQHVETDVELQLLIDDARVQVVSHLVLEELQSYTLEYRWDAAVTGTYNVTVYAPPVASENLTSNNFATNLVKATEFKGRILWDRTHGGPWMESYSIWTEQLADRGYDLDSLNDSGITPAKLQGYNVFMIVGPWIAYTPEELTAIQDFVFAGGGLLVMGDYNEQICTDLTQFAGITWARGGISELTTDITAHPVTTGVSSVYIGYPSVFISTDGAAQGLIRNSMGNATLAASQQGLAKVLGLAGEYSFDDYTIYQADNLRLANNMIDWLLVAVPVEHELAVILQVPKIVEFNESSLINATVRNLGLSSESNVEFQLFFNDTIAGSVLISELPAGAYHTLSSMINASVAGAVYNVTAYVLPVEGEETTTNNIVTRIVKSGFYSREYFSPRWVGGGTPMGWHADYGTWEYVLPFSFPFYGTLYDRIYVFTDGKATFDWNNWIAPAWDDWVSYDPYDTSYDIYVWQNSTHVGIEWYVRHYGSDVVADFEMILRNDGVIQFNYGHNDGPVTATIGISDGMDDVLVEYVTNLNYIETIIFTPSSVLIYDMAVTLLNVYPTDVYQGWIINVNVTVANLGNASDYFIVSLYYDDNLITMEYFEPIQPNETLTLNIIWDTWYVATSQNYTMKAVATTMRGETDTGNDMLTVNPVQVRIVGDANGDGKVDIFDCILASNAFGASSSEPEYRVFCDVNQDGIVDIFDMIQFAIHFGEGS
jgi:thermitase